MTTMLERAENELKLAGYRLEPVSDGDWTDDDYVQSIGNCVWDICKLFASQDHSGMSANITIQILIKLLRGETLSPLTNDPSEWECISPDHPANGGTGTTYWQSKRRFSCFSDDDLQTYYDNDAEENRIPELDEEGKPTGWSHRKPKEELVYHKLYSREELKQMQQRGE